MSLVMSRFSPSLDDIEHEVELGDVDRHVKASDHRLIGRDELGDVEVLAEERHAAVRLAHALAGVELDVQVQVAGALEADAPHRRQAGDGEVGGVDLEVVQRAAPAVVRADHRLHVQGAGAVAQAPEEARRAREQREQADAHAPCLGGEQGARGVFIARVRFARVYRSDLEAAPLKAGPPG